MKKTEKSVREKAFPPVKKPEKTSKMVFTGTFYFHGEKKNTGFFHQKNQVGMTADSGTFFKKKMIKSAKKEINSISFLYFGYYSSKTSCSRARYLKKKIKWAQKRCIFYRKNKKVQSFSG